MPVQQNQSLRSGDDASFVASKGTYSQVRQHQSVTSETGAIAGVRIGCLCLLLSNGYPRKKFWEPRSKKTKELRAVSGSHPVCVTCSNFQRAKAGKKRCFGGLDVLSMGMRKSEDKGILTVRLRWCFPEWEPEHVTLQKENTEGRVHGVHGEGSIGLVICNWN